MKGNINVVIDIEGEAPKGMIKKMQDLLAEYNSKEMIILVTKSERIGIQKRKRCDFRIMDWII